MVHRPRGPVATGSFEHKIVYPGSLVSSRVSPLYRVMETTKDASSEYLWESGEATRFPISAVVVFLPSFFPHFFFCQRRPILSL